MSKIFKSTSLIACISVLAACGGGGGGGGNALPAALPMSAPAPTTATNESAKAPAPTPAPAAHAARTAKSCTVDVYGDSIMAGNGTPKTPVMVLHDKRPALTLADHSAPGTLLLALGTHFANDTRTGHWVVIENGVIDAWQGQNIAVFEQTLRSMIDYVRAEGREPIVTGFSQQVVTPAASVGGTQLVRRVQYNALVQSIAADMHVPFADWSAVPFHGAGDLQDGIHPARAYSDRLIDQLAATFDAASGCQ